VNHESKYYGGRFACLVSQEAELEEREGEGKIPSADVSRAVDEMQANTRLWGLHHRFLVTHSLPLAAELCSH